MIRKHFFRNELFGSITHALGAFAIAAGLMLAGLAFFAAKRK